jgi:hydroxymethylglutaryl-CoA synthase
MEDTVTVIAGHGAYVPTYRIDREVIASQHGSSAGGDSAVPGPDENHVTMAAEAAAVALDRAGIAGSTLAGVFVASITDPLAEHGIAAQVSYRLGATPNVRTSDFRATARAASDTLTVAHRFLTTGEGPVLVVGVDAMPTTRGDDREAIVGAGAGALLLADSHENPIGEIVDVGQATTGFVERHRRHGRPPQTGDDRFERRQGIIPATTAAVDDLAGDAGTVDRLIVGTPDDRSASAVMEALEADAADRVTTFDDVGYAGAASPLLDTVSCLESSTDGERVLAIVYGAGGADALLIDCAGDNATAATVSDQLESRRDVTYAKHLEYRERMLPTEVHSE